MTATATRSEFGLLLRWWRTTRRFSQLELSTRAEVSSRLLSFLETGRSKPSREMILHLTTVLDLPLRDANTLLHAAGFAQIYSEFDLDAPEMDGVRAVLATILDAHMPNPAAVVDRLGNLVDANLSALTLMSIAVAPNSPAMEPTPNLNRLTFHPEGVRTTALNWEELAASLLVRLQRESDHRPADTALSDLLAEVMEYDDVTDLVAGPRGPTTADLIVPMKIVVNREVAKSAGDRSSDNVLSLFTTISTIGSPHDVTVDELRLETFFPADEVSRRIVDSWAIA